MIGAVLAGGAGRRLGRGSKGSVELAGRPLVAYPLAALAAACGRVAVVCKPDTELPGLDGAERWDEPAEPRHPLAGIVYALERAEGPVLVCAADMPFVTPEACRALLDAAGAGSAPAAVAIAGGVLQPVFGVYAPAAAEPLRSHGFDGPLTEAVEALRPVRVAMAPALVQSVNTPEDLAEAEERLASAGR